MESRRECGTFISGFHTRVDKIASIKIDEKLKGHILIRQANLPQHDHQVIIGAASGNYDVDSISSALRSVFCEVVSTPANQYGPPVGAAGTLHRNNTNASKSGRSSRLCNSNYQGTTGKGGLILNILLHSCGTGRSVQIQHRLRIDQDARRHRPGRLLRLVRKKILIDTMREMGVTTLPDGKIRRKSHRFGDYKDERATVSSVKVPSRSLHPDEKPGATSSSPST